MKISDILLKVSPISPSDSISKAAAAFMAEDVDLLPVIDEQSQLVGAFTHRDILSALQNGGHIRQKIEPYVNRQVSRLFFDEPLDKISIASLPAVVLDEKGVIAGIITKNRFIMALQSHLADSWERLSAVMNSVQNGLLAIDEQGTVIFANILAGEMIGKDPNAIIGHYITNIIPDSRLLQIMETGMPLTGQKFTWQGTPLMVNYAPILTNGKIAGAVGAFQNLSQLEMISEELGTVKALNRELEAIINSSYDGIWITDGQGVVLKINQASERFSERTASEVVGRSMHELEEEGFIDKSVTLLVMKKRERMTINQTVAGKRKLLVTGNPIFDDQGNLFRVVTNVRDVTELTKLQDQLLKEKVQSLKYKSELHHLRAMHITGSDLVFRSESMRQIVQLVTRVADVDSTVLITGESGTGKELIAKLIHRQGKGYKAPLITVNCAAIPEKLLESELFGYEGGSFTGAKKEGKPGMFELAHMGSLFLDEVGELPLVLQVKILRAIQDKEVCRIGGAKPTPVDVRIITATNKDLSAMLQEKTFREDLYYRLMVVPIHVPPLRDRREDIPLLIYHFVDEFNRHFGFWKNVTHQVVDRLVDYPWPGNVRELKNVIERMIVISPGNEITLDDLPDYLCTQRPMPKVGARLKDAVMETESYLLAETYKKCGSWQKVAQILGVNFTTIYRKAARYQLLHH